MMKNLLVQDGKDGGGSPKKQVGFTQNAVVSLKQDSPLRRRDTPHYLKDKRISSGGNPDEKVKLLLAGTKKRDDDGVGEQFIVTRKINFTDFDRFFYRAYKIIRLHRRIKSARQQIKCRDQNCGNQMSMSIIKYCLFDHGINYWYIIVWY